MPVALITGAGRGLGEQLALAFSESGHDVILHGRNLSNLESVQKSMKSRSCIVCGDIRSPETLEKLLLEAEDWNIDVLINNAGMPSFGLPFATITEEQIEEMVSTNVLSPIKLIRKMYQLLKHNKGTIININSICGWESRRNRTIYCASRWGMRGFDASLRLECEKDGIKLLGIYPSRIKTRPEFSEGLDPEVVVNTIMELYLHGKSTFCKLDDRPNRLNQPLENLNYA